MVELTIETTEYKYIAIGENHIPYIAGSTMKVVELITSHLTYGWSPAELHFQYPHLSLSQIHSALSYYWDHKTEIDTDIDRRLQLAKQHQAAAGNSPLAKPPGTGIATKLRAKGLL
jgi:uncharacterized protein (DUF433 family)